jgi:hypothetical protein
MKPFFVHLSRKVLQALTTTPSEQLLLLCQGPFCTYVFDDRDVSEKQWRSSGREKEIYFLNYIIT